MSNDLISREALKEALNTYDTFACLPDGKLYPVRELEHPEMFVTYIHVEDVIKAVDNAPTVEQRDNFDLGYIQGLEDGKKESPQGVWIPVSEKLPEVSQRCLVYTKYDEVMTDFFMGDEFMDNGFMQGDDVIAWRPLPEPYKKGGAENE